MQVGYDKFSYSYCDKDGFRSHQSLREAYGETFQEVRGARGAPTRSADGGGALSLSLSRRGTWSGSCSTCRTTGAPSSGQRR